MPCDIEHQPKGDIEKQFSSTNYIYLNKYVQQLWLDEPNIKIELTARVNS